jgi:hypothetical protein
MFWSPESISPEVSRETADIDELLGDLGGLDRFDRPPVEVKAGLGKLLLRLAEAQLDGNFVRLHRIDRLERPHAKHEQRNDQEHGLVAAIATRQGPAQLVLSQPDDVFQIGGRALRSARPSRTLAPRAAITSAAAPWAAATALVVPGHKCPFVRSPSHAVHTAHKP